MPERTADYVSYSHEIIWRAASYSAKLGAEPDSKIRSDHMSLQGLLMGFMAFEGFMNFLGEVIDPEGWEDERKFFNGAKYRGVEGKLVRLFEVIPNITLDKSREPYQTFSQTRRFRDSLAHNKPHRYTRRDQVDDDDEPVHLPEPTWSRLTEPEAVLVSLSRLKELAEMMREPASLMLEEEEREQLWYRAFEGPVGASEGVII